MDPTTAVAASKPIWAFGAVGCLILAVIILVVMIALQASCTIDLLGQCNKVGVVGRGCPDFITMAGPMLGENATNADMQASSKAAQDFGVKFEADMKNMNDAERGAHVRKIGHCAINQLLTDDVVKMGYTEAKNYNGDFGLTQNTSVNGGMNYTNGNGNVGTDAQLIIDMTEVPSSGGKESIPEAEKLILKEMGLWDSVPDPTYDQEAYNEFLDNHGIWNQMK